MTDDNLCKQVEMILPWYINGSLDHEEHFGLLKHLTQCDICKKELKETCGVWDFFDQHLVAKDLQKLAQGEDLGEANADGVLTNHLTECDSCQEELALMKESWQAVEDAPNIVPLIPSRPSKPYWQTWAGMGMAAALIAALGLGWFTNKQSLEIGQTGETAHLQPQANLISKDLFPQEMVRRSDGGDSVLVFEGFTGFALTLHTQISGSDFILEIHQPNGEIVWQASSVVRQENGTVSVMIPAAFIQGGGVNLQLHSKDGEQVEHYQITPAAR